MKHFGSFLLWSALFCPLATARAQAAPKPNVVLIYADDLGFGDLSCYGMTRQQTPNSDKLAQTGLRFTDAHSTSATCTPSRYSLLTGEYAFRQKGTDILPGNAPLIIAPTRRTLPKIMKDAGYRTGIVGKWHLGLGTAGGPDWNGQIEPGPREVGFDYSYILPATGDRVPTVYIENGRVVNLDKNDPIEVSYSTPFAGEPTGVTNPEAVRMRPNQGHNDTIVNGVPRIGFMKGGRAALWKDETMADTFAAKATDFIEKSSKNQPFFLYFPTHDVHVPRLPHPRFADAAMGARGAAIAEFDWSVGQILDALERAKIARNTLVILTSDNGPIVLDGYADGSDAQLGGHRPAGPFTGQKNRVLEGGTRLPFIVRWPERVRPGISNALLSQIDLVASLASLTGQKVDASTAPDSQNQLAALLGTSATGRSELVEQSIGQNLALRKGAWKFIPGSQPRLYNLDTDIRETTNLAAQNPQKVVEMSKRLAQIKNR